MRRLAVNRVGLSAAGWTGVCLIAGVVAAVPFLMLRRRVFRALLNGAWALAGDEKYESAVRRDRLIALQRCGLVGEPVFRACLKALEIEERRATTDRRHLPVTGGRG
jgi:hypothetical protein